MKVVLDKGAILPTRAHELDAGFDLYSREDAIIYAGDSWTFDTGAHGYLSRLGGRCKVQKWLDDERTYHRRNCRCRLYRLYPGKNFYLSRCAVSIVRGQKIAQLVIKKIASPDLEVVERLEDTDRGTGGFGSTGMF